MPSLSGNSGEFLLHPSFATEHLPALASTLVLHMSAGKRMRQRPRRALSKLDAQYFRFCPSAAINAWLCPTSLERGARVTHLECGRTRPWAGERFVDHGSAWPRMPWFWDGLRSRAVVAPHIATAVCLGDGLGLSEMYKYSTSDIFH